MTEDTMHVRCSEE